MPIAVNNICVKSVAQIIMRNRSIFRQRHDSRVPHTVSAQSTLTTFRVPFARGPFRRAIAHKRVGGPRFVLGRTSVGHIYHPAPVSSCRLHNVLRLFY